MRALLGVVGAWLLAGPASALGFVSCNGYQQATVAEGVEGAAAAARVAAAEVGEGSGIYRFWFGAYDPARAETVRATLKRVAAQLDDSRLTIECADSKFDCTETFAFVTGTPGVIRLCPDWFRMPSLVAGDAAGELLESGTREGTIIHEATHFEAVAGTGDSCYDRVPCATLAASDPVTAIDTADTYLFFAEDVHFDRAARAARESR